MHYWRQPGEVPREKQRVITMPRHHVPNQWPQQQALQSFPEPRQAGSSVRLLLVTGTLLVIFFVLIAVLWLVASGAGSGSPLILRPSGIAIIPLKGEITNDVGSSFGAPLTANEIVEMIDEAEKSPDIGAILIDIDSPGGEAVASKQIVYRIREAKKPVYSYINSVGASGAYYVAASTAHIMADRDSITGSIGVISVIPNVEELLGKIGVKVNVLKEGEHKDLGSPFREMTPEDKAIFQSVLNQIYSDFKADVLAFRDGKLSRQQLEEIADGRILSGKQAFYAMLVDELVSSRKKAISRAAQLAGIERPHEVPYGKREFTFSDILFSAGDSFGSGFVKSLRISASAPAGAVELK